MPVDNHTSILTQNNIADNTNMTLNTNNDYNEMIPNDKRIIANDKR